MAKHRAQTRVSTVEESCVSVMTTPITGSSTAHVMRGVNPHYREFLGDSFTPRTPINSSVCYWKGVRIFSWGSLALQGVQLFYINLLSSCFCLSIFEIHWIGAVLFYLWFKEKSSRRAWRSPGQQKTRFTFHRYAKNPALNKEEIRAWTLLSLVVGIWIVTFHWFKEILQFSPSNFLPVHYPSESIDQSTYSSAQPKTGRSSRSYVTLFTWNDATCKIM